MANEYRLPFSTGHLKDGGLSIMRFRNCTSCGKPRETTSGSGGLCPACKNNPEEKQRRREAKLAYQRRYLAKKKDKKAGA